MITYLVNKFDIVDEPRFDQYVRRNFAMMAKHGGKVVLGTKTAQRLEGPVPGMNVVIEFPSEEAALAYWNDPEYQPLKALRMAATINHACILAPAYEYGAG